MEFRPTSGPSLLGKTLVAGEHIQFEQVPDTPFIRVLGTGIGDLEGHLEEPNPHDQYVLESALLATLNALSVAFYNSAQPFTGLLTGPFSPGVRMGGLGTADVGAVRFDSVGSDGWTIYCLDNELYIESDSGVLFILTSDGNFTFDGTLIGSVFSAAQFKFSDGTEWLDEVDKVIEGGVKIPFSSVTKTRVTKTANYTATDADNIIDVDTTAGAVTITLPSASGRNGKEWRITKVAGANNVTIAGNINGAVNKVFGTLWESWLVYSNGTNFVAV